MYTGLGDSVLNITAQDFFCRGLSPFQWTDYCVQYREHADLTSQSKPPIPPPLMPPTVKPPETDPATVTPAETMNEILDQQWREWMAQNQRFMNEQAAAEEVTNPKPGIDFLPVALLIGAVALISFARN